MSLRDTISKVVRANADKAAHNVVQFPKPAPKPKPKRRGGMKPKVVKEIKPHHNTDDQHARTFTHQDKHGNGYKPVTIGGKPHMQREDGALFKLRKDGKWVLTAPSTAGAKRRSVLPYAVGGAAAGAAGAAAYYNRKRK